MLLKKYITLLPILGVHAVPLSERDHDESSSLLKEETLEGIKALMTGSGIPGLTIAITSPKGDEIVNIGNATVFGDPVTDDVSRLSTCHPMRLIIRPIGLLDPIPSYSPGSCLPCLPRIKSHCQTVVFTSSTRL